MPSPTYHNFYATQFGGQRREMLERERDAIGVVAELTGMFARSVGSGLHQLGTDYGADLLVVGSSSRGPVGRVLAGDDARGTVSGAACPVAVAPHAYAERRMRLRPSASVRRRREPRRAGRRARARCRPRARLLALTVVAPVPGPCGGARISSRPPAIRCGNSEESRGGSRSARPPTSVAFGDESTCSSWGHAAAGRSGA